MDSVLAVILYATYLATALVIITAFVVVGLPKLRRPSAQPTELRYSISRTRALEFDLYEKYFTRLDGTIDYRGFLEPGSIAQVEACENAVSYVVKNLGPMTSFDEFIRTAERMITAAYAVPSVEIFVPEEREPIRRIALDGSYFFGGDDDN